MEYFVQIIAAIIFQCFRYFLFAGGFFLVFYVWKKKEWFHKKIKQTYPEKDKIIFEIKNSIVSIFIFGLVGGVGFFLRKNNLTLMYDDFNSYSLPYFFLSIVLLILLHDTYFYWTHRLMHHPKLFKTVHSVHHQSHNPTPWAAFSFHPIEAVIEAGIFPLGIVLIPLHNYAVLCFLIYMILMNVLGHLGFEFMPPKFSKNSGFFIANTSTHHYMHHRYSQCNYGLYFNIWDRLMQTNHKKYKAMFEEVAQRNPSLEPLIIDKKDAVTL